MNFLKHQVNRNIEDIRDLVQCPIGPAQVRALFQLMHFLGPSCENAHSFQARFDYLASLPADEINEIEAFLRLIARRIAFRHRNAPPDIDSRFYAIYATGPPVVGTHSLQHLPLARWHTFVRSGAYEECLMHWMLSMSFDSFRQFFRQTRPPRVHWGWNYLWPRQLTLNRSYLHVTFNDVSATITLTPGVSAAVPHSASMDRFVAVNAYAAWTSAVSHPGSALECRGVIGFNAVCVWTLDYTKNVYDDNFNRLPEEA